MGKRFEMWDMRKYDESYNYGCKLRVSDPYTIKEKITYEKLLQDSDTN